MRLFLSVKGRLLVFSLCIFLVPTVIVTAIYYLNARNTLRYQILEKLGLVAESRKYYILSFMEMIKTRTADLSTDRFITNNLKKISHAGIFKQGMVMSLNRYLSVSKMPLNHHLMGIAIVDKYGKVISSTNQKLIGKDMSGYDVFIEAIRKRHGETFVGQPCYSPYLGVNCVFISAPVISKQHTEVLGVVINAYHLSVLDEIVTKQFEIGEETGEVYLINREKIMLTKSRFTDNAHLKQVVDVEPVRTMNKDRKEAAGLYQGYRRTPVIGVLKDIPEYGWMILAEAGISEAFVSLKRLSVVALILGVVGLASVTGLGIVFALSITRPMSNLIHAAEKFANRDLDYRIEVSRKDEIGNLASSLNVMAHELSREIGKREETLKELKWLNESLEQRIAERTAELVKINERLQVEIEERRQAEEALRMSESKYRMLLENLPQRIFYKDKNLVYVSCNENFARDFRIQPNEIAGKTDYDLYPKELAEKYRENDRKVMELGQTEDVDEKYIKDEQELVIHTIRTPIKDEKGSILGILGIFWDITENVSLQKEAERSRHMAALGELAAGVAHEINNPVNGIINCAQILFNKSSEGSKERDLANRILKEGNRVADTVHSLLFFARPTDKKEKKNIIDIHEILSKTLLLTEIQLQKEGIRIKLDMPQKIPEVIGYPRKIQQAFLNIINNARYALNQRYPGVHENKILEILGEVVTMDNRLQVKVTFYDHGAGIPADVRDKIMDPFFTTKPGTKGTGLGLGISHSIIAEHGGKLLIESVEGEFSKVSVVLPAKE